MSADADRNLLFGIFALQLNLITRDHLFAGMNTWTQRRDVPLSQILVEQQALAIGDVPQVDQLMQRGVASHAGDVTLCLQSMSPAVDSQALNELDTLTDIDLQATLSKLVGAAGNGDPTPPTSSGVRGSQSNVRFQDVVFHAEGGLGEVWKARDDELGREVALKRIKRRFSGDEESRVRFAWEAEITGNLEHPGIVPVYGFGRYADGRPYYAMRFIRGESLKHEIDEYYTQSAQSPQPIRPQNQAFRRLLKSLIDSCNTIHFAHCAGIIHRDIKPANIMVGRFGETLVVDWGLAKRLDAPDPHSSSELPSLRNRLSQINESTATQMGSAMGTPAYMSPEQAAGKWDKVGPASDTYSLGALLYHMLTGVTSIRTKDVNELLARVEKGGFPPPSEVNPAVPKPLNAICQKAMALVPENRYATVRELADDLECWLADQEVTAYPENRIEKASRWVRRNTTKVYAIAGSTLVVILAAIAITIASRNAAIASRNAAQEKAKGLSRLQQERAAVDEWVTGASQALNDYAGAQHAREEMLKKAVEHYEAFSAEQELGDGVLLELARNYRRLGDVQRRRGATLPEKLVAAAASYQKAAELLEPLRKNANNPDVAAEWAQSRIRQALMLADDRKYDAALQQLAETRVALQSDQPEIQEALAYCLLNEGSIQLSARKLKVAQEQLDEAARICDRLVAGASVGSSLAENDIFYRRLRAQAYAQALGGHCRALLGELQAGRQNLEAALRSYGKLIEQDRPRSFLYLEETATTRLALGEVLRRQAHYSQADDQFQLAIEELNKLGESFPDVPRMRELVATAHVSNAQLAFEQGEPALAHIQLRLAAPIMEEVRPYRKQTDDFKLTAMTLLDIFGEVLRDSKSDPAELADSLAAYQEVHDVAETVSPALAQEAGERVANTLSHRAQLMERQGDDDTAEALYREALAGLQQVADASRTARGTRKALVHAHLGDLLHRTERTDKASDEYKQALAIWASEAAEREPSPNTLQRLAWLLANCRDESQRDLQLADGYIVQGLKLSPADAELICTAALVYFRQKLYARSETLLDSLRKSPQGTGGYTGHALALLALNRWRQDQPEEARALLEECKQWQTANRPGNVELRDLVEEAKRAIAPQK